MQYIPQTTGPEVTVSPEASPLGPRMVCSGKSLHSWSSNMKLNKKQPSVALQLFWHSSAESLETVSSKNAS